MKKDTIQHKSRSVYMSTLSALTQTQVKRFWIFAWDQAQRESPQFKRGATSSALKKSKSILRLPAVALHRLPSLYSQNRRASQHSVNPTGATSRLNLITLNNFTVLCS